MSTTENIISASYHFLAPLIDQQGNFLISNSKVPKSQGNPKNNERPRVINCILSYRSITLYLKAGSAGVYKEALW
jgi:hypothetical protein